MTVEFTSYGYDTAPGEGLGELVWQEMFPQIGSASYGVRSPLDWKVTAVPGADRTVSIAAGRGFGLGVIDKTVANDTIQLDPISSGSRWDLIACRRDPTPTKGKSEFVKINGGATKVIPGGRLSGPGIHDQPLALVQVTAGQSQPTGSLDLRTWIGDGGGLVAGSEEGSGAGNLIRSFLNAAGTRLFAEGVDWVRRVGPNDTLEWVRASPEPPRHGTAFVTTNENGDATINLSNPFPSQLSSAQLTDVTAPQQLGAIMLKGTASTSDRTKITFRAYQTNGSVLAGKEIAVWYTAFGN